MLLREHYGLMFNSGLPIWSAGTGRLSRERWKCRRKRFQSHPGILVGCVLRRLSSAQELHQRHKLAISSLRPQSPTHQQRRQYSQSIVETGPGTWLRGHPWNKTVPQLVRQSVGQRPRLRATETAYEGPPSMVRLQTSSPSTRRADFMMETPTMWPFSPPAPTGSAAASWRSHAARRPEPHRRPSAATVRFIHCLLAGSPGQCQKAEKARSKQGERCRFGHELDGCGDAVEVGNCRAIGFNSWSEARGDSRRSPSPTPIHPEKIRQDPE